jgi:hypothetical protein
MGSGTTPYSICTGIRRLKGLGKSGTCGSSMGGLLRE